METALASMLFFQTTIPILVEILEETRMELTIQAEMAMVKITIQMVQFAKTELPPLVT